MRQFLDIFWWFGLKWSLQQIIHGYLSVVPVLAKSCNLLFWSYAMCLKLRLFAILALYDNVVGAPKMEPGWAFTTNNMLPVSIRWAMYIESFWMEGYAGHIPNSGHELSVCRPEDLDVHGWAHTMTLHNARISNGLSLTKYDQTYLQD